LVATTLKSALFLITVHLPESKSVSFRQGVDGYSGTVESQVLIRFDDIFGKTAGKIPANASIRSAKLLVSTFDQGDTVNLHRMLVTTGDASDQSRREISLDAATGKVLWNVAAHQGPPGQMHKFNTTASSTPAADGQKVYAAFADDRGVRVVAIDDSGQIAWSVSPGTFHSHHGFAACSCAVPTRVASGCSGTGCDEQTRAPAERREATRRSAPQ
jgi:outer membrane protein assembly factor BamB